MKQYFDFNGKVALVTGGSRGLGRAIVLALAEQGADVFIASRKLENCERVAEEVRSLGRRASAFAVHMGRWQEIDRMVEAAYREFGRVDILVNNAGMSPLADSSAETSEALFDKIVSVNFKGPFRLAALIGARMQASGGGNIINISSIGSMRPQPEYGPYAGAKAALNAATLAHSYEYGPQVRVNAILPGSFRTDVAKAWPTDRETILPTAIKRFGEPEEIVAAALYLASDAASYTTGSLLRVDGGWP